MPAPIEYLSTERSHEGKKRRPWIYVPTTYFAEGVPYVIVNIVTVVMYKTMGLPNRLIGLTSLLYLPWVIKMFWGPLVDMRLTKRRWIIGTQLTMALCFIATALVIQTDLFFPLSLLLFSLIAFTSATHDIATDGFYMLSLSRDDQALYAGVRSTFYRLAMIFASGGLVVLAGAIERRTDLIRRGWTTALGVAGIIFLCLAFFHRFYLPFPHLDAGRARPLRSPSRPGNSDFLHVFKSYFSQSMIIPIVAFILLYRLGEAMLVKMAQPFFLDPVAKGGLGLATETVGALYGTVGTGFLLAGGILGGWLISRFGFKRCIWPMALALNLPDLSYVYLAWARPSLVTTYALVAAEQFGYGLGFTAFTIFLMYIAREPFKTSHYAISTGLMAFGMMIPGALSGYIQERLGYLTFFCLVCLLTIPGMIMICFIPKDNV
ncbi:MAG: MFS transporter [Candidatus Aureabacteria bacterium]|nr:MFS transporter [Candidatus Auribacterota bacterium]